ncbi:MAG TPA: hypothetical protein VG873_16075 [Burkholderiales bacterium]|nr:hypothetical protein [Burkholderiales bacterium]
MEENPNQPEKYAGEERRHAQEEYEGEDRRRSSVEQPQDRPAERQAPPA